MQRPCKVITREAGSVAVIMVRGRLDPPEAQDPLEAAVKAFLEKGKTNFLMDLRSVSYISSTGIGSIIKAYRAVIKQKGKVKLLNPSQCVKHILSISKLDGVFEIYTDERAALSSFAS
jgi:anti-sigma B factor antagonist